MAKQNTDELYAVRSMDGATFNRLPEHRKIAAGQDQYAVKGERALARIVDDAEKSDARLRFFIRDAGSNLLIPLGVNPGHSPGVSSTYFTQGIEDGIFNTVTEGLEKLAEQVRGEEVTVHDVIVDVLTDWRNP